MILAKNNLGTRTADHANGDANCLNLRRHVAENKDWLTLLS